MPRLIPFSTSFSIKDNQQKKVPFTINGRALTSLTIEVVDDNKGPILVSANISFREEVHQIGQPTVIYNGDGYNAVLFTWQGEQPFNRYFSNKLNILASNYCGEDIEKVKVSGVVKR